MKRIGIIVAGSAYPMEGFKSGLRDLGWVEGEGICFELLTAEGQLQLLPKFASELVSLGVDLIAVIGAVTVRAVRQATTTIPTVFAVVVEPIGDGLAANVEHPGGNLTGGPLLIRTRPKPSCNSSGRSSQALSGSLS
jgi:putative ABC transport system substrate-binding protein